MNGTPRDDTRRVGAWFLGPKAENARLEEELLLYILRDYHHWRRNYYPPDEILIGQRMRRTFVDWNDQLFQRISEMLASLRRNFPFYSPRYLAHMLSDQVIPARLAYFAAMLYNPNNVTPEAAPVTVDWELQVGEDILTLLGYHRPPAEDASPKKSLREFGWAHITGGGTVANLEALWVARNVRYFPLAVKHAVEREGIALDVKLPGAPAGEPQPLSKIDERQCLGLKTNESIYLLARFAEAVRRHLDIPVSEAGEVAWRMLQQTGVSLAHSGSLPCYAKWPPAIFVSGTAHYSIAKSADVLGIGKDNVILVDVDQRFRLDVRDLEAKVRKALRRGQYPLAVVAIAGTTEEGAVDPVHKIVDFRNRLESEEGVSFWLHTDAAWGGYMRSLFVPGPKLNSEPPSTLADLLDWVSRFVARRFTMSCGKYSRDILMQWGSKAVCSAFLAFPRSESITVDPHKMGYVPYPCGVVAFRNDRVRHFLTQEAPYITVTRRSAAQTHEPPKTLGPFILEGSKPGAAAAACWLAHRMIPPNTDGYGEIMRASLLAARELHERLIHWSQACRFNGTDTAYEFLGVTAEPPDTNVVCFVVRDKTSTSLSRMNALTKMVYESFSIQAELGDMQYSYSQPFFLSRTEFRLPQYSRATVTDLLGRADVDPAEYPQCGVFVLRATVMTPYITLGAETGGKQDYLADFLEVLGERAQAAVRHLQVREQ